MPTLDMALFDWTDYEDLKPEVWPSAKKKGMSTCHPPCLGPFSSPTICSSAQPDLQSGGWVGHRVHTGTDTPNGNTTVENLLHSLKKTCQVRTAVDPI